MVQRFILNEVSYFGPGARKELPEVIARLGKKKALIVTDKDLVRFGVAAKVTEVLDAASIPYEIFSDVKPNPTVSNVNAGLAAFKASGRHLQGCRHHRQQPRIRRRDLARRLRTYQA